MKLLKFCLIQAIVLAILFQFVGLLADAQVGKSLKQKQKKGKVVAAKARSGYGHKNRIQELETRHGGLVELSEGFNNLIIISTPKLFQEYAVKTPRNYTLIVLFRDDYSTCRTCGRARVNFAAIARAAKLNYPDYEAGIFFMDVQYKACSSVFKQLGINYVPAFVMIPPYGSLKNLEEMDKVQNYRQLVLQKWIESVSGVKIVPPKRQRQTTDEDYYLLVLILIIGLVALIYKDAVVELLNTRDFYAPAIVSLVIILISGYMYNVINGSGLFLQRYDSIYIVFPGTRQQLLLETIIMAIIYGSMVFSTILCIEANRPRDPKETYFLDYVPASVRVNIAFILFFGGFMGLQFMTNLKRR